MLLALAGRWLSASSSAKSWGLLSTFGAGLSSNFNPSGAADLLSFAVSASSCSELALCEDASVCAITSMTLDCCRARASPLCPDPPASSWSIVRAKPAWTFACANWNSYSISRSSAANERISVCVYVCSEVGTNSGSLTVG
eukprot:scaffold65327_cov63-Phaeocystis_antarctica.AAC.2